MFGSNASLFAFLWGLGFFGGWGVGGIVLFGCLLLWFCGVTDNFFELITITQAYWGIPIFFAMTQIGKYGAYHSKDECGFIFDRPSGKVFMKSMQGDITAEYDFKDFMPVASTDHVTTGGFEVNTNLINVKTPMSVNIESSSFVKGVLAWNYYVRFMDVTQPLPDIPEHETTRHLDPITKAHDEKTGRVPNYWAKMTRKEADEIQRKELEKAKAWVEERKALLRKHGLEDKEYMNSLLPA